MPVQNLFSTLSSHQNPIAIKPCIWMGRMSNRRKAKFINGIFCIQSFWRGHGKILPNSWLLLKGIVCPGFYFIRPIEFLIVITNGPLTVWIHIMDHRKAERVSYRNSIRDFRRFGQSKAQKLSSVQSLFCPETEFSSEVGLWNSVTSKPSSGQSRMSNR
jgi:hypothetical protein